jgi:aspartyl-tRNA(Asn)/glutamyl-tRNA(Gln) amidotransferase subunit A
MLDDILTPTKTLRDRPLWQPVPDDPRSRLSETLPTQPTDLAELHRQFLEHIPPYALGNLHSGFMGGSRAAVPLSRSTPYPAIHGPITIHKDEKFVTQTERHTDTIRQASCMFTRSWQRVTQRTLSPPGCLLWSVAFISVDGEWFLMWQSTNWNDKTQPSVRSRSCSPASRPPNPCKTLPGNGSSMLEPTSPLAALRRAITAAPNALARIAAHTISCANSNASHNTYLHFNPEALLDEAAVLTRSVPNSRFRPSLYGIPISLKDCFDLTGTVTTCGSRFYAEKNPPARLDSAMANVLRNSGALITGKTHLHPLAYGITGQNPDYGDCLQPRDSTLLTGGSSSGAAASVQEDSALAAIGTDTGGSIRVPAVLCGLTGYRASHSLAYAPGPWRNSPEGLWQGAAHLAQSFDTPGFILRDPRDLAPIAKALFGVQLSAPPAPPRIGFVGDLFLDDANPEVLTAYALWRRKLTPLAAYLEPFNPTRWAESREIFAGIQAAEAAAIHAGHFGQFEPAIAKRLQTGASFTVADVAEFHRRLKLFRSHMAHLHQHFDLMMLPAAPVHQLKAAEDQSDIRSKILRYTTPFSLSGSPVISLPGELIGATPGTGIQLAAAPGRDGILLAFATQIAQSLIPNQATNNGKTEN